MKRAIIFYNGDLSDITEAKKYIKPSDYLICADGGAQHVLALGLKPDIILGDFDSLPKETQEKLSSQSIEWIAYDKEKDETDSELALNHAIKKGYKIIFLFGIFGSRIDHMLTNIFALDFLLKKGVEACIIEGKKEIRLIEKSITLHGKKGDLLSLIPLTEVVRGVKTKNLYYRLDNEDLFFGYSRGISNIFTSATATISLLTGRLLIIHDKL